MRNRGLRFRILTFTAGFLLVFQLFLPLPAPGFAVLAHQALIDVVWDTSLKPLLKAKYPRATEDELSAAQAYAYGGSILQDMGYYPHGSHLFSDLTHYVRSGDFVLSLLQNSQNVYDYAFALGALAHYTTDSQGHRIATNRAVPLLYPRLRQKYGDVITYEDDELAHVKTEFGFDVIQVAQGHYAPTSYHDFIGFEVSQESLDAAFQQTYGLELKSILDNEDKALSSYRHDVSAIIPKATRVAWSLKEKEIQQDEPGVTRKRFLYNLSRANYEKEWGKDYQQPGTGDRVLAFLYKLLPKFGPLRVLELKTPTPETEKLFEQSFNTSVTEYRRLLDEERSGVLRLPNVNFDVGVETPGGKYRLDDDAHAELLHRLAKKKFGCISPELRAELIGYFGVSGAPYAVKKNRKAWEQVQSELQALKATSEAAERKPDSASGAMNLSRN